MFMFLRASVYLLTIMFLLHQPAAAQFKDLVRRAPAGANAVVVLDVAKIHSSPLAVKEHWKEQHEQAMAAGLTLVPPQSTQYLLAAKLDFDSMLPDWSSSVMEVSYKPNMPKLAVKTGGAIDEFEGCSRAVRPSSCPSTCTSSNSVRRRSAPCRRPIASRRRCG